MRTKLLVGIVFFAITIYSCKTVQISDLKPKGQISKLLPALEPQIDVASLESAYSSGSSTTSGVGSAYSFGQNQGVTSIGGFSSQSLMKADKRIQEAITLFDREVKDNISNSIGENKGYIVCRIATSDTRVSKWGYFIPSVLTLYTINLLGVPFFYFKTELELEVEIKDLKNNTIGRYKGYGKSTVPIAMYYGYFGQLSGNNSTKAHAAARKSNIDAFKMAMNEIKERIDKDYSTLISKLN